MHSIVFTAAIVALPRCLPHSTCQSADKLVAAHAQLAQLIRQRFDLAAKKFEFNKFRYQLDTTSFRIPEPLSGKDTRQMSLL